jgi:hypothetical protein
LLQKNYHTEQSKNEQLTSQIHHQQSIIDTHNREVLGLKKELAGKAAAIN